jgi:hypothetical protein
MNVGSGGALGQITVDDSVEIILSYHLIPNPAQE